MMSHLIHMIPVTKKLTNSRSGSADTFLIYRSQKWSDRNPSHSATISGRLDLVTRKPLLLLTSPWAPCRLVWPIPTLTLLEARFAVIYFLEAPKVQTSSSERFLGSQDFVEVKAFNSSLGRISLTLVRMVWVSYGILLLLSIADVGTVR